MILIYQAEMNSVRNKALSFFVAMALLINSVFSFADAENLSDKQSSLSGLIPICTAFGIEYRKIPENGKSMPSGNHAEKHCVLCNLNSVSVGVFDLPSEVWITLPRTVVKSFLLWRSAPNISRFILSLKVPRAPPV